ncbi:MAG: hypothetical protein V1929_09525 [bacterium]
MALEAKLAGLRAESEQIQQPLNDIKAYRELGYQIIESNDANALSAGRIASNP